MVHVFTKGVLSGLDKVSELFQYHNFRTFQDDLVLHVKILQIHVLSVMDVWDSFEE